MNFRGDMNTELFCKGSEEVWNERIRELHNNNEEEVLKVLMKIKSGKSAILDGNVDELLKQEEVILVKQPKRLLTKCLNNANGTEDSRVPCIVSICRGKE